MVIRLHFVHSRQDEGITHHLILTYNILPMTVTYSPILARVKANPITKIKWFSHESALERMDIQMHTTMPYLLLCSHTLPTDQQFNLEFQFKSVFKLKFQPEFGIQLGIPIPMGINLGECNNNIK